jgi:hypothetical protein
MKFFCFGKFSALGPRRMVTLFAFGLVLRVDPVAAQISGSAAPSLEETSAYSLLLHPDGTTDPGYFPMGFIAGDTGVIVPLGYNLREDHSAFSGLPLDEPFPKFEPPYPRSYNLRYFSMAWPMNALREAIGWKGKDLIRSQKYGSLPAALDSSGKTGVEGDDFDPAVRNFYLDYVHRHVSSRLADPEFGKRILFWGLDNEAEGEPLYSSFVRSAFSHWLDNSYGGKIEILNKDWGANFPSFDAAAHGPLPNSTSYKKSPATFLDFWTFESDYFTGLLSDLAHAMHDADPRHRGVVHKSTQQTIEMPGANRARTFDHARFAELMRPISGGLYGVDMYGAGDRETYETSFIYNCIRPLDGTPGYGVMLCEANNHGGPGHQFAATEWRLLGNGLKAVDYFTTGWAGAAQDYDVFGFIVPATGKPKDKLFYAARWAQAVHRSETFWEQSAPAPNVPRLAILMPRRDVLLSDGSERNSAVSIWSYPENHRWMIYRWLRELGYWVDVIPYTKLKSESLQRYQGLFLIGAEHLAKSEAAEVANYVRAGGILVADSRVGYYDEHHGVANSLQQVTGIRLASPAGTADQTAVVDEKIHLAARMTAGVSAQKAKGLIDGPAGTSIAFENSYGKGRVLYLPFLLGTLAITADKSHVDSGAGAFHATGPTADEEDYLAFPGEFDVSQWLGALLSKMGLVPSYSITATGDEDAQGKMRLEQPFVDGKGNCAVVITTRAMSAQEQLPPSIAKLPLPGGPWSQALWAPAEDNSLTSVPIQPIPGGDYEVSIPALGTAGILYLFKNHDPLLGIKKIEGMGTSIDGETAQVGTGQTFPLTVQLFNTTGQTLPAGMLTGMVPRGWTITPAKQSTQPLKSGESGECTFAVTTEANAKLVLPDRLSPLVVRWSADGRDRAIISATVEVTPKPEDISLLLTDNKSYPATYPYRTTTGATYRYESPNGPVDAGKMEGQLGKALQNGFTAHEFHSSEPWDKLHFATYPDPHVEITYDLQAQHSLDRVVAVFGPGDLQPTSWKIAVSQDDMNYQDAYSGAIQVEGKEVVSPLIGQTGRYIRVSFDWPTTGGTLDELEVWGK